MVIKKTDIVSSTGKRKTSVARAKLFSGKGLISINNVPLKSYGNMISRMRIQEPLMLAGDIGKKVNIEVNVQGGGWQGQTSAARLAIGRVLANFDKKLKKVFLNYDRGLIVADVRRKETRKPNDSKARAKRQKSYR